MNTKTKKAFRESNIELLRIIAMLMIVASHFSVHGGFVFREHVISINRIWIDFLSIGGKLGVNIFVLISGYFLINSDSLKIKKVAKIWGQVLFYSVLFFWLSYILRGSDNHSILKVLFHFASCFLPISSNTWWFATVYFLLYLFHPYINKTLCALSKKQYKYLLLIMLIIWCMIPTFSIHLNLYCNELLWFIFLYALAGYYRIYGKRFFIKNRYLIISVIIGLLVTLSSAELITVLSFDHTFLSDYIYHFYKMNSILVLTIAVAMCLLFNQIKIRSKFINIAASTSFGVYLIHDHSGISAFL